ncbi:HD domain-containing protein [Candidatus Parcubacteria bacterium]|nr:HD domain-containing protein [Candidatus Parcubacteria bacterium]
MIKRKVGKNNIDFNEPFLTGEMETNEKDWALLEKMVEDFYKVQGVSKKILEHFVIHNKQVKDFVIKFSSEGNFKKREKEIVILSAILHDVAKGLENFELHGEKGGEIAEEMLLKIGKSSLLAQSVRMAIIRHMGEEGYPARMAKKKYGDDFKYPKPATIVGQMLYECDILTQLTSSGFDKLLHLRKINEKDIADDKKTALRENITQEEAALFSVLESAKESYNLIKIRSVKKFADDLWQKIQIKYINVLPTRKI